MNKNELALALIRAPWVTRLQDRTFWGMVATVVIALWLHSKGSIDGIATLTACAIAIGSWSGLEQINKGIIGSAAVKSATPDTVNVAGDVNTTATPQPTPLEPLVGYTAEPSDNDHNGSTDFSFDNAEVVDNENAG